MFHDDVRGIGTSSTIDNCAMILVVIFYFGPTHQMKDPSRQGIMPFWTLEQKKGLNIKLKA